MRPDDFEAVYAGAVAILAAAPSRAGSRQAEAASTAVELRRKVAEAMSLDDEAARSRLMRRLERAWLLVLAAYGDPRSFHQADNQARSLVGLTEGTSTAFVVTRDVLIALCDRGAVLRCPYPLDYKLQITDKGREVLAEMLQS